MLDSKALRAIFFGFACICTYSLDALVTNDDVAALHRLPTVYPEFYDLNFTIDLEKLSYSVDEVIDLYLHESTTKLQINSADLNINWYNVNVTDGSGQLIALEQFQIDEKKEIVDLTFQREITVGRCKMALSFSEKIDKRSVKGFYLSPKRQSLTTQFYPNFARTIFPSFDEREFKSKFKLSIVHDASYTAFANMPAENQQNKELIGSLNHIRTSFLTSENMSTNAFGFSLLLNANSSTQNEKVRIIKQSIEETNINDWALNYGVQVLNLMERQLNQSYPLPKIDFVLVNELPTSSINTWGLIRVKEPYLDYDVHEPLNVSIESHQKSANIIVGGIASGWFGDEVTPKDSFNWWMNEGIVKYFQYFVTSQIQGDWRYMDQFVVREMQMSMLYDDSTNEYSKEMQIAQAASIVRMIEASVGTEVFRNGLQAYIENHSFSVTTPVNLFESWQLMLDSGNISLPATVQEIFQPWFDTGYYPIVKINRPYLNSPTIAIEVLGHEFQFIPITISTANNLNFEVWVHPNQSINSNQLQGAIPDNQWILVNNKATGYYRVNYDVRNWNLLIDELTKGRFSKINALNRAQLIDDAFNLAKIGEMNFETVFRLFTYLRHENDFLPWYSAKNAFDFLERMLREQKSYASFQNFVKNLTSRHYPKLSIMNEKEENHSYRLKRLSIAALACGYGLPYCIDEVTSITEQIMNRSTVVIPELQQIVMCAASRHVLKMNSQYERAINKYIMDSILDKNRPDNEAVGRIAAGVGCTTDEKIIKKGLDMTTMVIPAVFKVDIRRADRDLLFKSFVEGSYAGTKSALNFLTKNFFTAKLRFESLADVFNSIGPYITTKELQNLLRDLITAHQSKFTKDIEIAVFRAMERGTKNIRWLETHQGDIAKWLGTKTQVVDEYEELDDDENEKSEKGTAPSNASNLVLVVIAAILWGLTSCY